MNILFISPRLPYPPNKGDKIRSNRLLSHLAENHNVWLATLLEGKLEQNHINYLRPYTREIIFEQISRGREKAIGAISLFTGRPVSVSYFHLYKLQQKIDALLDKVSFDVMFCYSGTTAEYLFRSKHFYKENQTIKYIMDFIDVDSFKWFQYSQRFRGWKKWIYSLEWKRVAAFEKKIVKHFDVMFLTSAQEKKIFLEKVTKAEITVLRNGVDLEFFSPIATETFQKKGPLLVFTGVMDYFPNVDAVCWFSESILPTVRKSVPEVLFYIVGSRPSVEVQQLAEADQKITVTGFVEDVRPYMAAADICIAPIRIARGVQNKILEAMSMGKPVVASGEAVTGINAALGKGILKADSASQFAEIIIDLLKNREKADSIGREARNFVERHYAWDIHLKVLDSMLMTQK